MRLPRLDSPVVRIAANVVEYIIVAILLLGGLQTGLQAAYPQVTTDQLQEFFGSRFALGIYGAAYFTSGLALLYAKLRSKVRLHGLALMCIYLISLFGFILEIQIFQVPSDEYLDTLGMTIFSGLVYLRYKYLVRPTLTRNRKV